LENPNMPEDVIPRIADRYRVSVDAARHLEQALRSTNGRSAQFNHPDLGGYGQWMPGMIMLGRMDDCQLRTRVQGLADEIAAVVTGSETSSPEALARDPNTGAASACVALPAGESWWPASFGHPSSSGAQNGIRYAYFPQRDRLLIQAAGRIDAFDTNGKRINGVSQQQSGHGKDLKFSGPDGEVFLHDLRHVELV
jgi:hypothetical protein